MNYAIINTMLRPASEAFATAANRDPVTPPVLTLVRHGYSYGQFVQDQHKKGNDNLYTEEFRRTSSSQWPLHEKGFAQSLRSGEWIDEHLVESGLLPNGRYDKAFHSPYKRARQTLGGLILGAQRRRYPEAIDLDSLHTQYPVSSDMRVREVDFGLVSTIPKDEFQRYYSDSYDARREDPMYARLPGGESLADLAERARNIAGALTRAYIGGAQSVLVVAHGRSNIMLDLTLRGIVPEDKDEFDQTVANVENGEVITLSRINPMDLQDERRSYAWRSSAVPWKSPVNEPPVWEEFRVKNTSSPRELLYDIPEDWLLMPPAGRE